MNLNSVYIDDVSSKRNPKHYEKVPGFFMIFKLKQFKKFSNGG